ncbi:MAG: TraR/DksA family transcriptional regulator [Elusimicrobiota bacterium]
MLKKELDTIKKKLLEDKATILSIIHKENPSTSDETDVGDEIDTASKTLEKELLYELTDNERKQLEEIENAIEKIEQNRYGSCESCRVKIPETRLKAIPSTRYCIECQRKMERG